MQLNIKIIGKKSRIKKDPYSIISLIWSSVVGKNNVRELEVSDTNGIDLDSSKSVELWENCLW